MFDFLRSTKRQKRRGSSKVEPARQPTSRGEIKFDGFTFSVKEYNSKGFVVDHYDKDLLIKGQKFRFEMDVSKGSHRFEGKGEALVTRIADNTLAAVFTVKPVKDDF